MKWDKQIRHDRQQKKKNVRKKFFFSNEEYSGRLNHTFSEFLEQKSLFKQL